MLTQHLPFPNLFLLDNGRVFPFKSFDPSDIKGSAQRLRRERDDEEGQLKMLNSVARGLRFRDWAHYDSSHGSIQSFMHTHGLRAATDLVGADSFGRFHLRRRQIADRLFISGDGIRKLFTGAQLDDDAPLLVATSPRSLRPTADPTTAHAGIASADASLLRAVTNSDDLQDLLAIVSRYWIELSLVSLNLLGDSLIIPVRAASVHATYFPKDYAGPNPASVLRNHDLVLQCFRRLIEQSDEGWVEVIPYNEKVVFLKGLDGGFDVLIRHTRDREPDNLSVLPLAFDHAPSYLRSKLSFAQRFYQDRDQWEELQRHRSEQAYYEGGGKVRDHPGEDVILEAFLRQQGEYEQPLACDRSPLLGFSLVMFKDGKRRYVQDRPVSVGELGRFLAHSNWSELRYGQDLARANQEAENLPAAATGLDAMAYCRFIEDETGRPVRLLRRGELEEIMPPDTGPFDRESDWSLQWNPRYVPIAERMAGAAPAESVRFMENLRWIRNTHGQQFLAAPDFFEWAQDGFILTAYGKSESRVHDQDVEFWGWQAGFKTGFRLCYDGE